MGRLDLRDKWRDEDSFDRGQQGSVDQPLTSEAPGLEERPLTEPHQMDVYECIEIAEKDAA